MAADTFAVESLYNAVTARFAAEPSPPSERPPPQMFFGWREAPKQLGREARRIVWQPGDPSGDAGKLLPPRNPGGNPRSLGTLAEIVTIWVAASDDTVGPHAPDYELLQYKACRFLYDDLLRHLHHAGHGTYLITGTRWESPERNEARYGATLRVTLLVQALIPDLAVSVAPVDTGAILDTDTLDVSEQVTVPIGHEAS